MSALTKKTRFINNPGNKLSFGNRDWNDAFFSLCDESIGRGMYMEKHPPQRDGMTLALRNTARDTLSGDHLDLSTTSIANYLHNSNTSYCTSPASDCHGKALDIRKRSCPSKHRFEVVTELGPEEVRWFYKEDKKTWKPFMGHDSLNIEIMYRRFTQLNPGGSLNQERLGNDGAPLERFESGDAGVEAVCVRGGLYEVDVRSKECYPVYWNRKYSSLTVKRL